MGDSLAAFARSGANASADPDSHQRRMTVQLVQKVVAREFNMSLATLLERTRRHSIARPRQVAMYLCTQLTQASLPDIGMRFGGFDHTTVMYARNAIAQRMDSDPDFDREVRGIARRLLTGSDV